MRIQECDDADVSDCPAGGSPSTTLYRQTGQVPAIRSLQYAIIKYLHAHGHRYTIDFQPVLGAWLVKKMMAGQLDGLLLRFELILANGALQFVG